LPAFVVYLEGPGGTDAHTNAAVGASFFVPEDVLAQGLDNHAQRLQILFGFDAVAILTGEFEHKETFLSRRHLSFEDIEFQVEPLDKSTDHWLLDKALREFED
jgi:hypothetical protein